MCGICGFIRKEAVSAKILAGMNNSLRHRGPDDEGYLCINLDKKQTFFAGPETVAALKSTLQQLPFDLAITCGLGFRRLSIIDLSAAGHQPMTNEDKTITITFNGQIYNYKALRTQLQQLGYVFHSESDTEVILVGYQHWGKDVVKYLNGMFAIAIVDTNKDAIYLFRDRLGLKPLFYHQTNEHITWASELKSVLKAPWVKPQVSMNGLAGNFLIQSSPAPYTCFQDVYALEAGWMASIDMRSLLFTKEQYWDLPIGKSKIAINQKDAVQELDYRLIEIIEKQLVSDVPVISMMSGGIDSTTITAIAHQKNPSLACYSFGVDGTGTGLDELPQSQLMARMLGIEQKIQMIEEAELLEHLEEDLEHFEEPYISPEIMLAPSRFLKGLGYKVILSGNGADEVFGGYGHWKNVDKWQQTRKFTRLAPLIPATGNFLKKAKNYLQADSPFLYYAGTRQGITRQDLLELLPAASRDAIAFVSSIGNKDIAFENLHEAIFYNEIKYSVSAHHVFRDDLSAMRNSVEMRYPYLDHTLVEWICSLPLNLRYNQRDSKPLLRGVADKYIHKENLNMRKKGFGTPLKTWWTENSRFRSFITGKVNDLKERNIFNAGVINRWQSDYDKPRGIERLFQLASMEVWLRKYID